MTDLPRTLSPEDVAVTLAVREDLGSQYDPAVIAEFLDRVGGAIDDRVDQRLAAARLRGPEKDSGLPLGIVSLAMGIPITAIAGGVADLGGIALAWAGIAAVNIAHAVRR